jgi:polyferredoxin
MDRVKRPRGLIRYASDRNLQGLKTRWLRPRMFLYTALLFLGIGVAGHAFSTVEKAVATATRMPGAPFYVTDTHIRNQYQVRLVNKDSRDLAFHVAVQANGLETPVEASGFAGGLMLAPMEERTGTFVVQVPRDAYTGPFPLRILIEAVPDGPAFTREVEFIGPDPALLRRGF